MSDGESSFVKVQEEINNAIQSENQRALQAGQIPTIDVNKITQKYIDDLYQLTNRPVLIYMVDFFNGQKIALAGNDLSISLSDKDGIIESTRTLPSGPLDIILHSPGGSLDATESIVDIIRKKFKDVRFFIPNAAKSAATMWTLSGDEIFLASSAELGPIDPQMIIRKSTGEITQSPAQAIIDQFETAQSFLATNPNKLPAWIPILTMYGPSLYQDAIDAIKLSKEMVRTWLIEGMFKPIPRKSDRINRAKRVVNYFADHRTLKSHGRRIGLTEIDQNLKGLLKISELDSDPVLYDKVMNIYYCFLQIFQMSPAFKVIQNNFGKRYIRSIQIQPVQIQQTQIPPTPSHP